MDRNLVLQNRLRSCLQTILDLEDDLSGSVFGVAFLRELDMISRFVDDIGQYRLNESDVARIEDATEHFLNELNEIVAKRLNWNRPGPRMGTN